MIRIIEDFIPATLPTRPGTRLVPTFVTIHNTDNTNAGAGAAAHNRYVRGADAVRREVSWHFSVDDRAIYQHLPTNEVGWHANRAANTSSIAIEICMNSDMVPATAYDNAAELVAWCIARHNLTFPACMKQHNSWTGKNCPRVIRAGQIISWDAFLQKVRAALAAKGAEGFVDPLDTPVEKGMVAEWAPEDADAILKGIDDSFAEHADHEEHGDHHEAHVDGDGAAPE